MSATIFCSFDQQDLADLAMGRLRQTVTGIRDVRYLFDAPTHAHERHEGRGSGIPGQLSPLSMMLNVHGSLEANVQPSRPISVRIVCDDAVRDTVAGKLVNLHAYHITTA